MKKIILTCLCGAALLAPAIPAFAANNSSIFSTVTTPASSASSASTSSANTSASSARTGRADSSSSSAFSFSRSSSREAAETPSPLVSYTSADAVSQAVGFTFTTPTLLPVDYQTKDFEVISNSLAEVFYTKGDKTILFRMSRGKEDISGDYRQFAQEKTVKANGIDVTAKGANNLISLATWTDQNMSYSLAFDEPVPYSTLYSIINSIR